MALRTYANAPATILANSCTNVQSTIEVVSTTGLPITYPFILIVDRGTPSEEVMLCTNASGTTLTVTRGYDSTTAFAHNIEAEVVHGVAAIDAREANTHVNSTSGVHGLSGAIVGTSDTQTLTNKTISRDNNTINGLPPSSLVYTTAGGELGDSGVKAIPAGAVVGTTDTQTLTNKNLTSATNTFPSTLALDADLDAHTAATVAHGATGAVVGTTNTQSVSNKTLTSCDLSSSSNSFPTVGLIATVVYSSSGTFTKATYPTAKNIRVTVIGGGGGGGGAAATGSGEAAVGGGGGAGGYAVEAIPVASLAASVTVTVGNAGSGGSGGSSGTGGGTSSFGAYCSGLGGSAGDSDTGGSGNGSVEGGLGGAALGGNIINAQGTSGGVAFRLSGAPGAAFSGAGGASFLGGGGKAYASTSAGSTGGAYGAGGSGAKNGTVAGSKSGGNGAAGVVIVEVFG